MKLIDVDPIVEKYRNYKFQPEWNDYEEGFRDGCIAIINELEDAPYDFKERNPDDFCSKGMKRLPLQEEIIEWLNNRAFFADTITKAEYLMQQIYLDNSSNYEGKQEDQKEIANNCKTVEDAYYYIQTHKLNVNKFYDME